MKILILTQFYPPEPGAASNRLSDLAVRLNRAGHNVTVLAAMPSYPEGRIFTPYRGKLYMKEFIDGIRIIRSWIFASPIRTFWRRILNYFSFVFTSVAFWIWRSVPFDFVIVESPPLFLGISGWLISRLRGAHLVMNVSDLWPESAVSLGVIHNPFIIRLAYKLEAFLYKSSVLVLCQTEGIAKDIISRFPNTKTVLATNGVDMSRFSQNPQTTKSAAALREFGLEGKFVAGYAGIHGLAQGLSTVVEAARLLQNEADIVFALFGDGPDKTKLIELSQTYRLSNLRFLPVQPTARMPEILSLFDTALIPLRKHDLFKGALPSKMFESMAAGLPLILSVEGEAAELVRKSKSGFCVEPENPRAIADAILSLLHDPSKRREIGARGRTYVSEHFSRQSIADRVERALKTCQGN